MTVSILSTKGLAPLPNLLDDHGKLILRSYQEYKSMDQDALRLFCHETARYTLPTIELINYLKEFIGDKSAIEVGAGSGDLGYHLGIHMTDSYIQNQPDVKRYYEDMRQPIVKYGADVEKCDALSAVIKYKPDVVIGSWVTHWIAPNLPPKPGSVYGVKEDLLLKHVKQYIIIGSQAIHNIKPIMKRGPLTIPASHFVISRSNRGDDKIWVWQGKKGQGMFGKRRKRP